MSRPSVRVILHTKNHYTGGKLSMDKYYPKNIDPRPHRRHNKDNPYTIFTVGVNTDTPHYYVSFNDGQGISICIEIEKEQFNIFNEFELEDISFINEWKRHYDLKEQDESSLNKRAISIPLTVEEIILNRIEEEQLHKAISALPEKQKRRLVLYFFECLTYDEIASLEGCTKVAVKHSIDKALKKLRKSFIL